MGDFPTPGGGKVPFLRVQQCSTPLTNDDTIIRLISDGGLLRKFYILERVLIWAGGVVGLIMVL
jgi:hypothetical protein